MSIVQECFDLFVKERLPAYRIGKAFYKDVQQSTEAGLNPYLKTEADVQVKFGGFMESYFAAETHGLVVHAELPIYDELHRRVDLSIHRVKIGDLWRTRDQVISSCVSAMEIKYANFRDLIYDFTHGGVMKDIRLLETLPRGVARYLIILDEAEGIEANRIRDILSHAKDSDITILSNNKELMT